MRTRVKICGITRPEDGLDAAQAGADAIGLVFYPPSPRAVSIDRAAEIVAVIPAFVSVVGLFVDPDQAMVEEVLEAVPLEMLQFHGREPAQFCQQFRRSYIKAIAMAEGADLQAAAEQYRQARGLLLDTYDVRLPGGTGQTFDWSRVPKNLGRPLILAGGLLPENVGDAVRRTRPWAVDVSGGVEQRKGIKDRARINEFIRGVNSV